jgi:hypothetical protein
MMADNLDDLKTIWKQAKPGAYAPVQPVAFQQLINTRVRNEQKAFGKFIWASGVWQLMIYVALTHLAVRFWNDPMTVAICGFGILLYAPFSYVFFVKFKQYTIRRVTQADLSRLDIYSHVKEQHQLVSQFFRFKRWFEGFAVPLTAAVMVLLAVKLGWLPDPRTSLIPSLILFGIIVVSFSAAILHENRKRFQIPLKQLSLVLNDIESVERPS